MALDDKYWKHYYKFCPICGKLCGRNAKKGTFAKHQDFLGNFCIGVYYHWDDAPKSDKESVDEYFASFK